MDRFLAQRYLPAQTHSHLCTVRHSGTQGQDHLWEWKILETQWSIFISIRATDVLYRSSLWWALWSSPWGSCWRPGDIQNSCCCFHSGCLNPASVGWWRSCFPFGARHGAEKLRTALERESGFKIQRLWGWCQDFCFNIVLSRTT